MELRIVNKSEKETEVSIDGVIGWDDEATWGNIKKQLLDIANSKAKKIIVNINSLGGYVGDGLMIHDALKVNKAEIETRVFSMTASAATVIAQAGDKRKMSSNALYLIHHASNIAWGNVNDLKAALQDLEKVDEVITDIYLKKGADEKKVRELMDDNNGNGRWIDAEEALAAGLIDEIIEPSKAAAFTDFTKEVLDKYHLPPIPEKYMNKKGFFEQALDIIKGIGKSEEQADEPVAEAQVEETAAETTEEKPEISEETDAQSEEVAEAGSEEAEEEKVAETEEKAAETASEEDEKETEEASNSAVEELRMKIQALEAANEDLQRQVSEARSLVAKAGARSTRPKGSMGRENDDIENINIPFAEEIKSFDDNFILGKPLSNPKQKTEI
jgi:ATP-dependent protease ClpP protease subunit